ncbi:MAG: hypothetical protein HY791_29915 [Deltaproteobacteria bacterium]|nr:hypothetical protein [Deltaproteobacteria bacterium]
MIDSLLFPDRGLERPWVALVIDVHARRVISVFSDQPSATAVCSFLEDTITSRKSDTGGHGSNLGRSSFARSRFARSSTFTRSLTAWMTIRSGLSENVERRATVRNTRG